MAGTLDDEVRRPPHGTGVTASLYAEYAREQAQADDALIRVLSALRLDLANTRFARLGVPVKFGNFDLFPK